MHSHLRKSLLLLFFALPLLSFKPAQTLDQTQYWMKIRAKDKFERSAIAAEGVSIEVTRPDFVIAIGNIEELKRIEKAGRLESSYALTEDFDFPSEDAPFHNYDELVKALRELQAKNPKIVSLTSIGKSVENRDLWSIRISGNLDKASELPGIIFMGGHHSREHLSVETPLKVAQYLVDMYNAGDAKIMGLIDNRDIHIIPAVNPDGLEFDVSTGRYKYWRKNRSRNSDGTYGVDLNRNYAYGWGTGGSSTNPSSDVYMGPKAFSEPETQAIKNYIEANKNLSILLSFHTFSELILYPWGHVYEGIENARDKAVHETMAKRMAQWNGYTPQQASELYIASGDTVDWAYGTHKIIGFTFELDPSENSGSGGFYPGAGAIQPVFDKNLQPVLYLIGYADNPYRVLDTNDPLKP